MAGERWQPKTWRRSEKAFGSSTHPVRIVTDAGPAYIKVINNPIGPHALVREWVCTHLARWFGLSTFDCAILTLDAADEVVMHDGEKAIPGPAFVTRAIEGGSWSGSQIQLRQLDNPADITRLVIFDTWTCNPDRYPPPCVPRRPRVDNVFLTGEGATPGNVRLIAMDFTECFASTAKSLMAELAAITTIKNDNVYGLFPEFKPHVKIEDIRKSVARLDALDRRVLSDIVRDLPSEWDFSAAGRQRLVDFLEQRARHLVDTIIDRLRRECWPDQIPFD